MTKIKSKRSAPVIVGQILSYGAKVMKDPAMANFDMKTAPFDGKRLIYGGFKQLLAI